ncbi:DUF423 domain-containing protein [Marinicella sp. W31]|uniref:DUF423 domain-containing protein n=1 Tax=Marinicella sp. W31 TaxID=3023713 RepID=UPI003757530F
MPGKAFWFLLAALYGASGVLLAAAGRHVFDLQENASMSLFYHAVFFQIMHAILLMGLAHQIDRSFWVRAACMAFSMGVLLFCGGLYILLYWGKTGLSWITPVGGSFLILGWINLVIYGARLLKR